MDLVCWPFMLHKRIKILYLCSTFSVACSSFESICTALNHCDVNNKTFKQPTLSSKLSHFLSVILFIWMLYFCVSNFWLFSGVFYFKKDRQLVWIFPVIEFCFWSRPCFWMDNLLCRAVLVSASTGCNTLPHHTHTPTLPLPLALLYFLPTTYPPM